jgi:hypothetical protein
MKVIKAWQHIYARVEQDRSPQRQSGFQTLFFSHEGIGQADLQNLERRTFFDVNSGAPYKRQYFPLSAGRVVVSQAVPLAETDRFGRGGMYLVHNLIFEAIDWETINCQPFFIFSLQPFATRLDEIFKQGEMSSGNIGPVLLEVKEIDEAARFTALSSGWNREALTELGWLALHAAELQEKQARLAIVGSQEVILNTLELAFLLVPSEFRKQCFFDTDLYRNNHSRTPVWMAGFSAPQGSDFTLVGPLIPSNIAHGLIVPLQPKTMFERWWLERIQAQDYKECITRGDLVLAMEYVLEGRASAPSVKRIRDASLEELSLFSRVHRTQLESRGREKLSASVPAELVSKMASAMNHAPEKWWSILLDGISIQGVSELANLVYALHPTPNKKELAGLEQLAVKSRHGPLMSKVAFWERDRNPADWKKTMRKMSPQEYALVCKELVKFAEVDQSDWLCEDQIETWLDFCLPASASDQVVNIADRLIAAQRGDLLDLLTPKVDEMDQSSRVALKKLLDQQPDLAPGLKNRISLISQEKKRLGGFFKGRRDNPSDK